MRNFFLFPCKQLYEGSGHDRGICFGDIVFITLVSIPMADAVMYRNEDKKEKKKLSLAFDGFVAEPDPLNHERIYHVSLGLRLAEIVSVIASMYILWWENRENGQFFLKGR